MANLLGKVGDTLHYYLIEDKEAGAMVYLMVCGVLVNLAGLGLGIRWLISHVRIV